MVDRAPLSPASGMGMAVRKSEQQLRRHRAALKARVVGVGAAGLVALGGAGAAAVSVATADPAPAGAAAAGRDGQPAQRGGTSTLEVGDDGTGRAEGALDGHNPSHVVQVRSGRGLASAQVYVTDLSVLAEVRVDGQAVTVEGGVAEVAIHTGGQVEVEVATLDGGTTAWRMEVEAPPR